MLKKTNRKCWAECVELLENRQLLTSVVVNTIADLPAVSGTQVSLRAAISQANAATTPTTITFDPTVFSARQTIALTSVSNAEPGNGVLQFNNTISPITVIGPSAGVTVNAGYQCGVSWSQDQRPSAFRI